MRVTQPVSDGQILPYNVVKILGCTDVTVGFDILNQQPTVSKRRYCNKVLVHECITVPSLEPLALDRVEFLATDDPCYKFFNIFKSSDTVGDTDPTIELQLDEDDLVIGILVNFTKDETRCLPLRMSYRINGYVDDTRVNLAQGNLYISPCPCAEDVEPYIWVDVEW